MIESNQKSLWQLDRRAVTALPALALALALATDARSAPVPSSYVAAGVDIGSGPTGPIIHDSGPQTVPLVTETASGSGATANGSTVSGSGFASADVFGNLKVSASDAVTTVPADWPAVNMLVTAVADRVDTFHFLPSAGTSISFLATLEWSGPSVAQCPAGTDCIVNIINRLNRNGFVAIDNSLFYDSNDPNHQSLPGTQSIQQIWTFSSPASFVLDEQLYLGVAVSAYAAGASFVADLSHTGHFYLDPITPDATYTTESGNLYYTPVVQAVPEPHTWALLCGGMLVLGFRIRHGRFGGT
jgi:hypothetical protein